MKRETILSQARTWLGYNEANGSHKQIIDIYNAHRPLARGYKVKYIDEWCATFVSAVAIKCGATAIIPTECGCEPMINLFKNLGSWVENDNYKPKGGDVIFYDWEDNGNGDCVGRANHVGIVEEVHGNTITVIEGNKNEMVARRHISIGGRFIRGYGVPKYENVNVDIPQSNVTHDAQVDIEYRVKTLKHGWLPFVKNLEDYAGWENSPIVGLALKVSKGSVKYRVHVKGGSWLGWITDCNLEDYYNGYAGNNKPIDAIQIYYYTPNDIRPYKKAKYRVNNYDWQHDIETSNGQDGYAGDFGVNVTKLRVTIE